MASSKAHHATGFAAGVISAAIVARIGGGGSCHLGVLLRFIAGVAGSTAPDWLEVAWWSRARRLWITHRTITHWGVGWLALLAVSYHWLGHSLYLWNSGHCDLIVVGASWAAAWFIGAHVWLPGGQAAALLQHLRIG